MKRGKGRVPNIVYGYDKIIGDYFNLKINEKEAEVIQQMYRWYVEDGYGAAKISQFLNERDCVPNATANGARTACVVF